MTRAYGWTLMGRVTRAEIVTLLLLGCWLWRGTMIPWTAWAQENSPFAGMVAIPGGPFLMGRDSGPTDEQPAHRISLPTFYIDRNLVTVAEFATFVQTNGLR